ncbi:MAG TPA: hypothetical protein VJI96_05045 [Candidatus Andersenbacteria bacterium]|nr:hypothetical protein [Candidatus Andersenbacteria bacterium]
MKKLFTLGETIILLSAICWLLSLPFLLADNSRLWFIAQGLYFIGVACIVWKFFSHYVRH